MKLLKKIFCLFQLLLNIIVTFFCISINPHGIIPPSYFDKKMSLALEIANSCPYDDDKTNYSSVL